MTLIPFVCLLNTAFAPPDDPFASQIQSLRAIQAAIKLEGKEQLAASLDKAQHAADNGQAALALYYLHVTMPDLLGYQAFETDGEKMKVQADLNKYWADGGTTLAN